MHARLPVLKRAAERKNRLSPRTFPQNYNTMYNPRPRRVSSCLLRCPREPLPFNPVVPDPPVLACDHPEGFVDGYDRPLYLFDRVLNSSVLHKCASDFVAYILGSSHR